MDFNRENSHMCPCKNCPKKGCGSYHDICPEFLDWRKKLDARNEAERVHHKNNDTISDAKRRKLWKGKRYSRQVRYNKSNKAD